MTNAAEKPNKDEKGFTRPNNNVHHILSIDFDGCWPLPPPIALETLSDHLVT